MKNSRFALVALITSLITLGGFWVFMNSVGVMVAVLPAILISIVISLGLGYLFAPFDTEKKYNYVVSFLLSTGIFLAVAYLAIFVVWYSGSKEVSEAALALESLMVFTILCPIATISGILIGACIAFFTRLGLKMRSRLH